MACKGLFCVACVGWGKNSLRAAEGLFEGLSRAWRVGRVVWC